MIVITIFKMGNTPITPKQISTYSVTKTKDMSKISQLNKKLNYQSIERFQNKLDKNFFEVPCATCDLGFLALAVKATDITTVNSRMPWVEY